MLHIGTKIQILLDMGIIRYGKFILFLLLYFTLSGEICIAQQPNKIPTDTLRITLQEAEQLFIQKNLLLLAAKYNVESQRALILQAKLYPNPYLTYTNAVYNSINQKYFDVGHKSDNTPGVSQMILLANKRKKQIGMAETGSLLAEDRYLDLLRTLKFTLRSDFFSTYYLQQTEKVFIKEIDALKKILFAFQGQLSKGNISKTEVVRVQAQLYALQSEYNDLKNNINDNESEVRTLLDSLGIYVIPVVDTAKVEAADPMKYTLSTLLDSASKNRTDLKLAKHSLILSDQNLTYQKSLAVPDITLGVMSTQASNFIPNELSYSFGLSVPIFNRNQGNIRSAKFQIKSYEASLKSVQLQYEENVYRAWEKALAEYNLFQSFDKNFSHQFDQLARSVLDNYTKRNIGLLDFLNFYESYKQNIVQLNSIRSDLANSYENINYMTGTDFFNK
jgi:outer membrane protein, heavy metal efflux system